MKNPYDFFRDKEKIIKKFVASQSNLQSLFTGEFFSIVEKQVNEMERTKTNGPINSLFLWLIGDSNNSFKQALLLEKYVDLIFTHPNTTNADRNHIIGQIKSNDSTDTLFEINILGNLLTQLPIEKIELFPRTVESKDVEARVFLVDRWIYLDATALNDSAEDVEKIDRMLNKGDYKNSGGPIDFDKDSMRYWGKIEYKSQQFIPENPNVLILSMAGT
jgi:hypothetical protein